MVFEILEKINEFIWGYAAFLLILGVGIYFSIRSHFFQVRRFIAIFRSFLSFFKEIKGGPGIHPLKVFFAAVGGCIGIGNIVGIVTAVQIGGPGALFWTWIAGLAGMLIQYSEVYLGLKHRKANTEGSYDGGPMYFLPRAYKGNWIAPAICILLCVYGVEIFMFNVMTESISANWNLSEYGVVAALMIAILVIASGGINRVGEVCGGLIPLFVVSYMIMSLWVIFQHAADLPSVFQSIFEGAFTAQAAQGGFAGSTVMMAISMGLSRGAYSGDIGVGYTSVIYAESRTEKFQKQASMTIIGVFLDTFVICTLSILLVLVTGYWHSEIDVTLMVQTALGNHFPYMNVFMPVFLFLLGYTTILAYFVVGAKCAKFISPKWGPTFYYLYACIALPLFAFVEATQAFVLMSLSGALLLILNLSGIFLLRKEIQFGLDEKT
jgi:AGCS family alanine or glycine:cation symporter